MESFLVLFSAALGAVLFVCGYLFGKDAATPKAGTIQYEASEEELKAIKEERERLIREQEAFKDLMNYNADMAYGVTANPLK